MKKKYCHCLKNQKFLKKRAVNDIEVSKNLSKFFIILQVFQMLSFI